MPAQHTHWTTSSRSTASDYSEYPVTKLFKGVSLNIKKRILVTRSKKRVMGLEGYGLKITKQEIIK